MRLSLPIRASVIAAALLLACPASRAQSVNERMASGDVFARAFRSEEALRHYLPAVNLEPENVPLLLRIARQYRDLMTDAVKGKEKLRLGNLSLVYALRAAALAPDDSEAQLSPAISYGKMAQFQGSKERMNASPLIKAAADRALKLNPRNDDAWHVLGRWHEGLAEVGVLERTLAPIFNGDLPETTYEEAVRCFEKAIALNPRRVRHYIELGRTYAQMGRNADARRFLEKGLAMPNLEKDDPAMKLRGREEVAKLP